MSFYNCQSIVITGSLQFLPHVVAMSTIMWPWTCVVISGILFTFGETKNKIIGWYIIVADIWLVPSCVHDTIIL